MSVILATILAALPKVFASTIQPWIQARFDAAAEDRRGAWALALKTVEARVAYQTEGMKHRAFWVPWLMATVPMCAWFGYAMLDTLFNGALPDTASIPPGLADYAPAVWQSLFVSGGGVKGAEIVAAALRRG